MLGADVEMRTPSTMSTPPQPLTGPGTGEEDPVLQPSSSQPTRTDCDWKGLIQGQVEAETEVNTPRTGLKGGLCGRGLTPRGREKGAAQVRAVSGSRWPLPLPGLTSAGGGKR